MAIITNPVRVYLGDVDLTPFVSAAGIELTPWQCDAIRRVAGLRRATIRIDGYWGPTLYDLMPTIRTWLEANGIPPGRVPITEVPRIDRTRRTIRLWVYDEPKRVDRRHRVAGRRTAVYLAVRPPAELRDWLRGKVRP